MTKTITKVGDSQGLFLDVALMDLAHLQVGDELPVAVHEAAAAVVFARAGTTARLRKLVKK